MRIVLGIIGILLLSTVYVSTDPIQIEIVTCPNCSAYFLGTINSANESLYCALYDISHPEVLKIFDEKYDIIDIHIITEKKNHKHPREYIEVDSNFALMHNKFCVIDESIVITGSANPTINGFEYNDNILIKIKSKEVVKTFVSEFTELLGEKKEIQQKKFNYADIYFCPEDNCRNVVISEIRQAKKSIYFATFVFTDYAIATELVLAKKRGVEINGVIEKRMFSISVGNYLLAHNISVINDSNPKTMHHKLFVIDNTTIITGSYNPTQNGNSYNDETLIVLRNKETYADLTLLEDKNI